MSKVRLFGHSILWLSTVSVAILAVILLLTRLFMLQLPAYKNDLELYLSEEVGLHLSIGNMAASLDGFKPQIRLKDISLEQFKQQQSTLNVDEIRLSFNFTDLLLGRLIPSKTTIVGTRLSIRRFADGHISIEGVVLDTPEEESSADFSWLLEEGAFEVQNSELTWQDDTRDVPNIHLSNAHVLFENTAQRHRLGITANLPKAGSFTLSIDAKGNVLSGTDWTADTYLKAKKVDLQAYLTRLKIDDFAIQQGVVNVELWSHWDSAHLSEVKGLVSVDQMIFSLNERDMALQSLASQLVWRRASDGWDFQLDDFVLQVGEASQPESHFSISYRESAEHAKNYTLTAGTVDLQTLSYIAQQVGVLKDDDLTLLAKLAPNGSVDNTSLVLNTLGEQAAWSVCGDLNKVSNQAAGGIPGLDNISARICSTQEQGWLNIQTKKGEIDFKGLFRDAIVLNRVDGLIRWAYADNTWEIDSKQIALQTPHAKTVTRLNISLPVGEQEPQVDIQMNFKEAEARFVPLYLPAGIMEDKVVSWLDNAFIKGNIMGGGFLLKGPLNSFPYRNKKGLFQVLFNAEEIDLHYGDRWPDVLGVSASIEFKNESLTVLATKGLISDNQIKHAVVTLPDLLYAKHLNVSGRIEDDVSGLYRFFSQSPLNKSMQGLLDNTAVSGRVNIDLDIDVAVKKKSKNSIRAQASLLGNQMVFPTLDLTVEGVKGTIFYNDKGLRAKELTANIFGEKVDVAIKTTKKQIVVSAKGTVDVLSLAKKYPASVWKNIKGRSLAALEVKVPYEKLTKSTAVTISLHSQLQGVSINLPKPIGKTKRSKRTLKLVTRLKGQSLPLSASYGRDVHAKIRFIEKKNNGLSLDKADLHLGRTGARLPPKRGIRLSGQVAALDIGKWEKALSSVSTGGGASALVNQLNLKVAKLVWQDSHFDDVHLIGQHKNSTWSGEISSPVILGRYFVPDNLSGSKRIKLDLEMLSLADNKVQELDKKTSPLSPDDMPNMDIKSKKLVIAGSNMGELNLQLRQKGNGLIIQRFDLTSKRDRFKAKGAWEVKNGISRTALNGSLKSESLGGLLADAGISDKLNATPTEVSFDLHWPGEPQAFSKDHVSGFAKLISGKGRLLDVEPGIGRVFGLLSLSSLQRRLQLDFSDLVQKGLSFDKIKGRLLIVDGEAQTKRFYLESPSVRLDFQGRVGLATEDLDQIITVNPKTSESLPLAGAIAGGPLVGAAVFIVQKIAGDRVNKLVGYQYKVSGSWKDPKMEQLSKPGGKIFGLVNDLFSPVLNMGSLE